MSEWQDKSDFEINKAVAVLMKLSMCEGQHYKPNVSYWGRSCKMFNPCNNPSDAWPIILSNRININAYDTGEHWFATTDTSFFIDDKNPLRAAMIVYLEMNGVKP